jgi:thioredoxin 1
MKKLSIMVAMSLCIMGWLIIANQNSRQEMICKDGVCSIRKDESMPINIKMEEIVKQEDAVIEVTVDNFEAIVKKATKPVVIDFYATWCRPCKSIKPIFSELAQEEKNWVFAAIDVDTAPTIMASCGVQAMPTFVIFKDGVQWGSVQGVLPKEQLMIEFKKIISMNSPILPTKVAQMQQLKMAILQKNQDQIKKLLTEGVDSNGICEGPDGSFTPLQIAILFGSEEIIDILINSGAVINKSIEEYTKKQIENFEKMTEALQQSFDYARNKIIALPVSRKQTAKISELELRQRFMMAMRDTAVLKDLINEGADINVIFEFGKSEATPLYLAIMLNNKVAIDILIDAGASFTIEITNEYGSKKTVENMIKEDIENYNKVVIKTHERFAYTLNKIIL